MHALIILKKNRKTSSNVKIVANHYEHFYKTQVQTYFNYCNFNTVKRSREKVRKNYKLMANNTDTVTFGFDSLLRTGALKRSKGSTLDQS